MKTTFDFEQLPEHDAEVIRQHSRSFSLAARLLPGSIRNDVEKLYAWCRWCDDAIDQASSMDEAEIRLDRLQADVELIAAGRSPGHPASFWLADLVEKYQIPTQLPLDLLQGMKMDVETPILETEEELLQYCYRAAGTVGLIMCYLMGVRDHRALQHAKALGIAMQLTNIARDVNEDWHNERRYLPRKWLPLIPKKDIAPSNRQVKPAVESVLQLAEEYYDKGLKGLRYLPNSARFAIRLAAGVYRAIGTEIQRQDYAVMSRRAFVPDKTKLAISFRCVSSEMIFRMKNIWRFPRGNNIAEMIFGKGESIMKNESLYLVFLGLALTFLMGTTLFVLMGINPKASSYEMLPWVYAAGCATISAVTAALSRHFDRQPVATAVRVSGERHSRA